MTRTVRFSACVVAVALALASRRAPTPRTSTRSKAPGSSPSPGAPIAVGNDRRPQRPDRGGRRRRPAAGRRRDDRRRRVDRLSGPDRHGHCAPDSTSRSPPAQPATVRTLDESERWKRDVILRPESRRPNTSARCARADEAGGGRHHERARDAAGRSFQGPERARQRRRAGREPQSAPSPIRGAGLQVVKSPVALHVALPARRRGGGYPESLLGAIAFVRQTFSTRSTSSSVEQRYAEVEDRRSPRPAFDPALDAMQPALGARTCRSRSRPSSSARSCGRSTWRRSSSSIADHHRRRARRTRSSPDLKAPNARVIFSLNYPDALARAAARRRRAVRELRCARTRRRRRPALAKAGVPFAFSSAGLTQPRDFVRTPRAPSRKGCRPTPRSAR